MGKDTNETPSAPFRLKATHYFRIKRATNHGTRSASKSRPQLAIKSTDHSTRPMFGGKTKATSPES